MEEEKKRRNIIPKPGVSCLEKAYRRIKAREKDISRNQVGGKSIRTARCSRVQNEVLNKNEATQPLDPKLKEMTNQIQRYKRKYKQYRAQFKNLSSLNLELTEKLNSSLNDIPKPSFNTENMQEKLFAQNDVINTLKKQVAKLMLENDSLKTQLRDSQVEIASLKDNHIN